MYITDDPLEDFARHDAEQARELEKLPICAECGEPIQTEECYEINDELVCPDCLEYHYRKEVEDYIA